MGSEMCIRDRNHTADGLVHAFNTDGHLHHIPLWCMRMGNVVKPPQTCYVYARSSLGATDTLELELRFRAH